ncbi:MAG TPA: Holliday junction resolvase RuvX [Egibacteraceae bacterium]|nr:Holliday junction resolvase RuvX [Egibacteraceae bacterium]
MRVLGIDAGEVRIGVALSDPDGVIASPLATVPAGGDAAERLAGLAREHGCALAVVGLPKGMSGRDTASTQMARRLAKSLGELGLDVTLWDERLSSAQAERVLLGAGRRRDQRRAERDRVAAAIILQSWLDAHGGAGGAAGPSGTEEPS